MISSFPTDSYLPLDLTDLNNLYSNDPTSFFFNLGLIEAKPCPFDNQDGNQRIQNCWNSTIELTKINELKRSERSINGQNFITKEQCKIVEDKSKEEVNKKKQPTFFNKKIKTVSSYGARSNGYAHTEQKKGRRWTKAEESLLLSYTDKTSRINWKLISQVFDRPPERCRDKYNRLNKKKNLLEEMS